MPARFSEFLPSRNGGIPRRGAINLQIDDHLFEFGAIGLAHLVFHEGLRTLIPDFVVSKWSSGRAYANRGLLVAVLRRLVHSQLSALRRPRSVPAVTGLRSGVMGGYNGTPSSYPRRCVCCESCLRP